MDMEQHLQDMHAWRNEARDEFQVGAALALPSTTWTWVKIAGVGALVLAYPGFAIQILLFAIFAAICFLSEDLRRGLLWVTHATDVSSGAQLLADGCRKWDKQGQRSYVDD